MIHLPVIYQGSAFRKNQEGSGGSRRKTGKELSMGVIPSLHLTLIARGILEHTLRQGTALLTPMRSVICCLSPQDRREIPRHVWLLCCGLSNTSGPKTSCEEGRWCQPGSKGKGDWVAGSKNQYRIWGSIGSAYNDPKEVSTGSLFFVFCFFATSLNLQNPTYSTRDRTCIPCIGSIESWPLECHGSVSHQ